MKLYPKKLRSVEDLKREKKRVLRQKFELDQEEIFSLKGVLGGDTSEQGGGLGMIADMLPVSPLVSMGIKMAGRVFSRNKNRQDDAQPVPDGVKKKKGKSTVMRLATEVLGGYLKWKAAELSYKGAKTIIKKRREKRTGV